MMMPSLRQNPFWDDVAPMRYTYRLAARRAMKRWFNRRLRHAFNVEDHL